MAVNPRIDLLLGRMRKLRLPQNELAVLADVHKDTLNATFTGRTDPLTSTLSKIETALEAEEDRIRDYLVALRGPPQTEARAA